MNSTEWNITLHLNEFDESWMRYAYGMGSHIIILNSRFLDVIFVGRLNVELFLKKKKT